jgi:hypothetical protein
MIGIIYNHKYKNTQKKEINGWENIINIEIDLNTSNSKLNMFTNTKEVELYDLAYEYSSTLKKKFKKTTHQFMIFSASG